MEESEDNMSIEDLNYHLSPSLVKDKPKKRSLVERELETNLTARVTSPIVNCETKSTSRYGRARRLIIESDNIETDKSMLKTTKSPKLEISPKNTVQSPVNKMHASNSPIRTKSPCKSTEIILENQIENIYNETISLSRFASSENLISPSKRHPKVYIRKDLIQSKDKDKDMDETVTLIKNIFSPVTSSKTSGSRKNTSAKKSSEKHKETRRAPTALLDSSVVKTLDFDGNKKIKKETDRQSVSKDDVFEIEARCTFQVGDLAWARMGTFPFWPCIITREPSTGFFVKKKLFGRVEHDLLHVTFFGDNGRRSWIVDTMLRTFLGQLEFEVARSKFTAETKRKDPRLYMAYCISEKKMPQWSISVEEAEMLLREPKRFRIDLLNNMLQQGKNIGTTPKVEKSKKIVRTDSDVSLSESLFDTLFSEDDCKVSDIDRSRSKSRNKSLDVSEVVTACLDNMAAKTGITKIQRQSHMDRWLQKAKCKTPEKYQINIQKTNSIKKKRQVSKNLPSIKPYTFRKSASESPRSSTNLLSNQNDHDYSVTLPAENNYLNNDESETNQKDNDEERMKHHSEIGFISKVESLYSEEPEMTNKLVIDPIENKEAVPTNIIINNKTSNKNNNLTDNEHNKRNINQAGNMEKGQKKLFLEKSHCLNEVNSSLEQVKEKYKLILCEIDSMSNKHNNSVVNSEVSKEYNDNKCDDNEKKHKGDEKDDDACDTSTTDILSFNQDIKINSTIDDDLQPFEKENEGMEIENVLIVKDKSKSGLDNEKNVIYSGNSDILYTEKNKKEVNSSDLKSTSKEIAFLDETKDNEDCKKSIFNIQESSHLIDKLNNMNKYEDMKKNEETPESFVHADVKFNTSDTQKSLNLNDKTFVADNLQARSTEILESNKISTHKIIKVITNKLHLHESLNVKQHIQFDNASKNAEKRNTRRCIQLKNNKSHIEETLNINHEIKSISTMEEKLMTQKTLDQTIQGSTQNAKIYPVLEKEQLINEDLQKDISEPIDLKPETETLNINEHSETSNDQNSQTNTDVLGGSLLLNMNDQSKKKDILSQLDINNVKPLKWSLRIKNRANKNVSGCNETKSCDNFTDIGMENQKLIIENQSQKNLIGKDLNNDVSNVQASLNTFNINHDISELSALKNTGNSLKTREPCVKLTKLKDDINIQTALLQDLHGSNKELNNSSKRKNSRVNRNKSQNKILTKDDNKSTVENIVTEHKNKALTTLTKEKLNTELLNEKESLCTTNNSQDLSDSNNEVFQFHIETNKSLELLKKDKLSNQKLEHIIDHSDLDQLNANNFKSNEVSVWEGNKSNVEESLNRDSKKNFDDKYALEDKISFENIQCTSNAQESLSNIGNAHCISKVHDSKPQIKTLQINESHVKLNKREFIGLLNTNDDYSHVHEVNDSQLNIKHMNLNKVSMRETLRLKINKLFTEKKKNAMITHQTELIKTDEACANIINVKINKSDSDQIRSDLLDSNDESQKVESTSIKISSKSPKINMVPKRKQMSLSTNKAHLRQSRSISNQSMGNDKVASNNKILPEHCESGISVSGSQEIFNTVEKPTKTDTKTNETHNHLLKLNHNKLETQESVNTDKQIFTDVSIVTQCSTKNIQLNDQSRDNSLEISQLEANILHESKFDMQEPNDPVLLKENKIAKIKEVSYIPDNVNNVNNGDEHKNIVNNNAIHHTKETGISKCNIDEGDFSKETPEGHLNHDNSIQECSLQKLQKDLMTNEMFPESHFECSGQHSKESKQCNISDQIIKEINISKNENNNCNNNPLLGTKTNEDKCVINNSVLQSSIKTTSELLPVSEETNIQQDILCVNVCKVDQSPEKSDVSLTNTTNNEMLLKSNSINIEEEGNICEDNKSVVFPERQVTRFTENIEDENSKNCISLNDNSMSNDVVKIDSFTSSHFENQKIIGYGVKKEKTNKNSNLKIKSISSLGRSAVTNRIIVNGFHIEEELCLDEYSPSNIFEENKDLHSEHQINEVKKPDIYVENILINEETKIKETDPDCVSINSEESEMSLSKRKSRWKEKQLQNDKQKAMEDPEFLKYLEFRQDSLIDENPELSQEEITNYLYKTWLYEESLKSDKKNTDEVDQTTLVKGHQELMPVKKIRKKVKVITEKEKETSISSEEHSPKEKSRRAITQIRPFYTDDLSDMEDELFDIFKRKPSPHLKKEPKVPKFSSVIENTDMAPQMEIITSKKEDDVIPIEVVDDLAVEKIDLVEMYFQQLTATKPNVFKGLIREKVCEICENVGNLVKCKTCHCMFHMDCAKNKVEVFESPLPIKSRRRKKKRGRKPKNVEGSNTIDSGSQSDEKCQDPNVSEEMLNTSFENYMENNLVANADDFEAQLEAKMKEILNNPSNIEYDSATSDDVLYWSDTDAGKCKIVDIKPRQKHQETTEDFKCNNCSKYETPVCFVCKSAVSPKDKVEHRQRCQVAHCYQYYHLECLDHWPQTQFNAGERSKNNKKNEYFEAMSCPRHVCHTCVSDDPRGCKTRFSGDKLARCVRCPATYHTFTKCIPAGTQILTGSHIVCPRHYQHRPGKVPCHVNTGWCFICALGGTLICCEYCPTSFHAECLNINPPEGGYMCEDCETGRLPLYGEMVWVKLGQYRWWPGIILHPSEIPHNIMAVKHSLGEFVVRFFGQYDHYWVNRGRVFPFQEGDTGKISSQKSKIDAAFTMAVDHAKRACEILKMATPNQEESQDIASSLLPPHYVKLKVNKPCGILTARRPDLEESSLTQCECDPNDIEPCGPYSQCLNRMLLTECGPTCRAGDRCNNRSFEKRLYPKMEPYRTPHRGWGLKALEDIKAGQFVIEYVGELISEDEFRRRMSRKHEVRDENFYFLTLDKERMIDAGPKGNLARFMNHSCEGNCETQKWTVLGDIRVGLFAINDIPANSELTFNYNLESTGIEKKRCMCGAKRCSGYIGAKPKQDDPQPKKNKQGVKKTTKKRKTIALSPTTSKAKPKQKLGRPVKPREMTEIEKDLLIIKNATNAVSSDSECSRLSIESKDSRGFKRKRIGRSSEDFSVPSPSVKRAKLGAIETD